MAKQFRKVGNLFLLTDGGQTIKQSLGVLSVLDTLLDEYEANGIVVDTVLGNVGKPSHFGVSLTKLGVSYVVKIDTSETIYVGFEPAIRAFTNAFKQRKYGNNSANYYIAFDGTAPIGGMGTGGTGTIGGTGNTSTGGGTAPTTAQIIAALKADTGFMGQAEGNAGLPGQDGTDETQDVKTVMGVPYSVLVTDDVVIVKHSDDGMIAVTLPVLAVGESFDCKIICQNGTGMNLVLPSGATARNSRNEVLSSLMFLNGDVVSVSAVGVNTGLVFSVVKSFTQTDIQSNGFVPYQNDTIPNYQPQQGQPNAGTTMLITRQHIGKTIGLVDEDLDLFVQTPETGCFFIVRSAGCKVRIRGLNGVFETVIGSATTGSMLFVNLASGNVTYFFELSAGAVVTLPTPRTLSEAISAGVDSQSDYASHSSVKWLNTRLNRELQNLGESMDEVRTDFTQLTQDVSQSISLLQVPVPLFIRNDGQNTATINLLNYTDKIFVGVDISDPVLVKCNPSSFHNKVVQIYVSGSSLQLLLPDDSVGLTISAGETRFVSFRNLSFDFV